MIRGIQQHRIAVDPRQIVPQADTPAPRPSSPQGGASGPLVADVFERGGVASVLQFGGAKAAEVATAHQAQAQFARQFQQAASDPRQFHHLLQQVYGKGYDAAAGEELRQKALQGDFSWLPRIEFQSEATLQGGLGAYDAERNVVYLNEKFVGDPAGAAQVYSEEVGHALDQKLNRADTAGDEGEMFRRLLAGEKLTAAQRTAIQTENDHGVITVDGKQVSVEFWNPFKAIGDAAKAVGNAIGDAAKAVGNAVGDAAKAVGNAVGTVAGKVWDGISWVGGKVADAAKWVGPRLLDAGRGLVTGVFDTVRGAAQNIWEGISTFGGGLVKIFKGDFAGGFKDLGMGLLKTFVQTPVDAVLMGGGRAISAIQTMVGLEPPGRELTAAEIASLRSVYGDSIDYSQVRIKEGNVGLFGASGRPFTHGNTIYIPQDWLDKHPNAADRSELLVHEMAHVWQHQNGGTDYMSEALGGQWFGDGYNFGKGLSEGKGWADLNPEQQAELLEKAFEAGYLSSTDPNRRFLVRVTDPESDHGFEVQMVSSTDPNYATLIANGYGDYTSVLNDALRQVRSGEGAP